MSEVALVNLALFSLLLPSLISILNRTLKPSTQLLNLRIVQSSLLILTLGSILIAFAPTSLLLQICTSLPNSLSIHQSTKHANTRTH